MSLSKKQATAEPKQKASDRGENGTPGNEDDHE